LQRVAACCSVLQCVAVYCSVLQCVAVCCSVLQCVATSKMTWYRARGIAPRKVNKWVMNSYQGMSHELVSMNESWTRINSWLIYSYEFMTHLLIRVHDSFILLHFTFIDTNEFMTHSLMRVHDSFIDTFSWLIHIITWHIHILHDLFIHCMSHSNLFYTYEWVMSHIWMSHVIYEWVMYGAATISRLLTIIGLFCRI